MRLLFCSPCALTTSLGMSKVLIELAEEMRLLGWECDLVDPDGVARDAAAEGVDGDGDAQLAAYLRRHGHRYDVVDYDHGHLPFPRVSFPEGPVMVARVALLAHHFTRIQIPRLKTWRERLNVFAPDNLSAKNIARNRERAHRTVTEADVVSVLNERDRSELMRSGIAEEKIVVIPNGMTQRRIDLFRGRAAASDRPPVVVFVGTFDSRKGARDFPGIVGAIAAATPGVRFRLVGTAGRYQTENEVRAFFPRQVRNQLEIIPRFAPDELPDLLAGGSVGIFPSYIEGFGLGVLEMLAAGIPVFAYDAPGPPCMLPAEYLIPPGDIAAMAERVTALLHAPQPLAAGRTWARARAREFSWKTAAATTDRLYRTLCLKKRQLQPLPLP